MVEFYLLTFPRFPLRKKKRKKWFSQESNSRFPHEQVYMVTYYEGSTAEIK